MLGAAQKQWLFDQRTQTTARWRVIGQQLMMGQLKVVGTPDALCTAPTVYDVLALLPASGTPLDEALDTICNNNLLAYNPLTGQGAVGVEFVCTSVTSAGLEPLDQAADLLRLNNPHMKFIDLARKGDLLLDITPERTQGEWWYWPPSSSVAAATR